MLSVTGDERVTVERAMTRLWQERAGPRGVATLTAPINVGWGRK